MSKVLREHIPLFHQYYPQDPVYILTKEQSVKLLKRAPEHIGRDPMVVMYDIYKPKGVHSKEKPNYHGFRLNLGMIKNPQQALAKLQEFLKFVTKNRTAECLSCEVQRELHREGLSNMVNILREASEASLELILSQRTQEPGRSAMNEEGDSDPAVSDRYADPLLLRPGGQPPAKQAADDLQCLRSRGKRDRRGPRRVGGKRRAQAVRAGPRALKTPRSRHGTFKRLTLHRLPRVPHGDRRPTRGSRDRRPNSPRSPRVQLSWGPETIALHDEETFGTAGGELSGLFLRRVFSVQEVRSVHIDRAGGKAEIRYVRGKLGVADLLQRLAAAMRSGPAEAVRLLPLDLSRRSWRFIATAICCPLGRSWESGRAC